jgi:hypothetical protein
MDTPSITQLSSVISQATAPAFLLGALSGFMAILITRFNRIIDRSGVVSAITDDDPDRARLKEDLPRLKQRAKIINDAIIWAVASSITVAVLIMVAFASAFFHIEHERGVAVLFVVALGTFTVALIKLAREVRISLVDFDYMK